MAVTVALWQCGTHHESINSHTNHRTSHQRSDTATDTASDTGSGSDPGSDSGSGTDSYTGSGSDSDSGSVDMDAVVVRGHTSVVDSLDLGGSATATSLAAAWRATATAAATATAGDHLGPRVAQELVEPVKEILRRRTPPRADRGDLALNLAALGQGAPGLGLARAPRLAAVLVAVRSAARAKERKKKTKN
jgi:hypothetical protein